MKLGILKYLRTILSEENELSLSKLFSKIIFLELSPFLEKKPNLCDLMAYFSSIYSRYRLQQGQGIQSHKHLYVYT